MEPYIIMNSLSDITCMSELTPTPIVHKANAIKQLVWGLIHTITYSPPTADRKLCVH